MNPFVGPNQITAVALRERDYYKTLADDYRDKTARLTVTLLGIVQLFDADDPHMDPAMAAALQRARAQLNLDGRAE